MPPATAVATATATAVTAAAASSLREGRIGCQEQRPKGGRRHPD
jgi:hypothetical protein